MKSKSTPRKNRTICIGFPANYDEIIKNPSSFRAVIDDSFKRYPELFPLDIVDGYELKESRISKKTSVLVRRILINGVAYTIRPSFVMPYMTGLVEDVEKALFFRKWSVPYWGLAHAFGKNPMYWYRMETSLGRNSVVGTTIKSSDKLPENLSADEKHTHLSGEKAYIPTVVGEGCILGVSVTESAGQEDLEKSYGVFKEEAQNVNPDYSPKTCNTDGWKATINALKSLFPDIVLIACFLHIFISIRDRSRKKFKEVFQEVSSKLWDCYKAETKASFSQRVRRLWEWVGASDIPTIIKDKIDKLRNNLSSFSIAYDFENSHRTSNMIDRLMQRMDRYLFCTQYFHGSLESAILSIRGWALIQNFSPSNPYTVLVHDGLKSPVERLEGFCYHENWLQNLLISASLGGYRSRPPNPL